MKRLNKYTNVLGVAAIACTLTACNLDPEVTEYVTQERHNEMISDPETQPAIAKAAMSGIYSITQEFYSSHDDFGLRAFQMATDVMCEDVAYLDWNWWKFDYKIAFNQAGWRRTRATWGIFYGIISKVNKHLETYFANDSNDPAVLAAKGEALALRGVSYFHLVNFYQHTYKGHEKALGVPLTLKSTDKDLPRATVEDVYKQIIADLSFEVEHGVNTATHTDMDRSVAAAYLAKVYAQMENWPMVEKYAVIAQEGGASDIVSVPGRAWDIKQADILWGYDVNGQNATLWASFWSHIDQFIPFYAGSGNKLLVHSLLYKKIPETDSRRKLWVNLEEYKSLADGFKAKSYNKKVKMEDYDQLKFISGEEKTEQDYCFIRVQDPILLEIEALVEQGKLNEAKTKLTAFAKERNPKFVAPNTQEELRQEVRFQRRIELWFEGTNWFDMKRWKLPIDRTGKGTNHHVTVRKVTKTDSNTFYHALPQRELDANKNLVQNKLTDD